MEKTLKHVSKVSKAKWDKGLKQLRDAVVEPIEGGFIPPDCKCSTDGSCSYSRTAILDREKVGE